MIRPVALTVSIFFICALFPVGCSNSTDVSSTDGQLSMTAKYTAASVSAAKMSSSVAATAGQAVDSIQVSKARFVLRDIKFKTQSDSSNFKSTPFVLELNLAGQMQEISSLTVPFNTYRRIEFDVHRIEQSEANKLPAAEQVQFQDFLAGERYSIIINGTAYLSSQPPKAFIFRSKIDAKQKIDLLPELVVNGADPSANVTMLVSSAGWFKSPSGALLDPTDVENESMISENLKSSIRVFKDNNKDGSKD